MAEKFTFYSPPIWDSKNLTWDGKNSVWDRKKSRNFVTESHFPAPDWGSVGPVLNYKDKKKPGIEHEEKNETFDSPSFSQVKNISAECPITKAFPCSIPFNISKSSRFNNISNHLCKTKLDEVQKRSSSLKYTEDDSFWQYGFNGKLDALEIHGENYLIHPAYRDGRQRIVISNIKSEKSNPINSHPGETVENISFGETEDIISSDGICQIISKSVGNNGFALLRSKKDVSLVHLNGDLENSGMENTPPNSACWTVCSSLSSEMPGLWSVVYEDGTVEVHPAEGPQIWGTHLQADSNIGQMRWYGCEFGHHPLSLMIAGRSSIFLADLRTAGSRRDNAATAQRSIFKTENMASFIDPNEQICTFKKCDKNPYVYAVLNKTVLMFDIRHCKVPCMKWQHMIPSRPTYASTINIHGKDECLILGSKEQQSVCFLPGMWEGANSEIRYSAVGLPNHVKLIRDTFEMMQRQDVLFSYVANARLRTNMIGMVPVNLTNDKEFFLITLNSPGDLIYQKFNYNRKEEFREVPHSAIEAWRTWERETYLESSSRSPEFIYNSNLETDSEADVKNFLYDTKTVKTMEKDTNLVDDIFDDLPINYNIDELFKENNFKALPPLASSWKINEELKDKQQRILRWEERGTRPMGRPCQASMNRILVKNYKLESESTKDNLKKFKKRHGIVKRNNNMDSILRNLPHSVVRSLSKNQCEKYKDTLSSSVLARWENSKTNLEDVHKKEVFYGRAPFDPEKLSYLPRCLNIGETEKSQISQPSQEESIVSQVSQTPSQKYDNLSETSSQMHSFVAPSTSTNTLSKSPFCKTYNVMKYTAKKKRKSFVAGF